MNTEIKKVINEVIKDPYSAVELSQEQLETIIKYASDKFFNTKTPVMEDNIYDILIDFLRNKFPKSKVLKEIGTKIKSKNKVVLDYWLGSMDKIKPGTKDLDKWLSKYNGNYVLSDKLDGISALLVYNINNTINMYTRGTASEGLDITPLIKYLNLPEIKLRGDKFVLRGELILEKDTFEKNWSKIMKNARNTVSGLVNSKNINPNLAIDTKFVAYEVIYPLLIPEEQLKLTKKLGFNTVHYKIVSKINFELLSEYLKKRRTESNFIVDGIIVTNNQMNERNIKGNPEYAFAFKDILEDQMTEAKVIDIEWNISKDGLIKPVLILEPVHIGGVEITRVTGHNARNIVDKHLGKGAIIILIRSGDVIPTINKVIKKAKTILLPGGEWSWNSTNVDIIATNLKSNEILIKNIYYFFSSLDTRGLGEKIVEKLVKSGLDTIKKILEATKDDFIKVDGIKDKSASNLVMAIKKAVSNVKLNKFMAATNKLGAGIGEERIKIILDNYPDLLSIYKQWTKQEFINKLKELNGFEEKISSGFVNNFEDFIKFYNDIKNLITINQETKKKIISNEYSNLNICISGFRDSELEKFLINSGSKIVNSINKNTQLLIVKDNDYNKNPSTKVLKAIELNIKIITRDKIKI